MSHQSIVSIKVAGYQTGIGVVAVLGLQTERVFRTICLYAKATGIAVAINLDETLFGLHLLQ